MKKKKKKIIKKRANKNMEPLIFRNGKDISIQRIVLDVIRDAGTTTTLKLRKKLSWV